MYQENHCFPNTPDKPTIPQLAYTIGNAKQGWNLENTDALVHSSHLCTVFIENLKFYITNGQEAHKGDAVA